MNKNIFKVGIYLRLSDEDKNKKDEEDDSESIKNQRNLLLEEIKKRPNFVLVDEYCDEDLSGAGTFRPEFERLIKDCENKKIDIVLCKSQSRFSRDMEIIEKYIHNKFIEWNIRFISLTDNADTENKGNKKARQINGLVNEWYLEDVSNNIRSAFNAKMKQGEFISPFAPFGYKISNQNNNKLIIDPIAAEVVKKIYKLYLEGLGYKAIANYLNNKNIPSPSLYKYQNNIKLNIISTNPRNLIKWSSNAVKKILTNEIYIGNLVQGKRTTISYKNHKIRKKDPEEWITVKNTHEAIIDKHSFNKVNKLIKERKKQTKHNGSVHLFSGKVFCLECNHYMRKKNSSKHQYLVCSQTQDIYNNCDNKNAIRYDILENIILKEINNKLNLYYDRQELEKNYLKGKDNYSNEQVKSLENQKINIQKKQLNTSTYLKNLYEDKINNIITVDQFKTLLNTYVKEEETYIKQIDSINNFINTYQKKENYTINLKNIYDKYKKFEKLNNIIIDEFIDTIYIGKLDKKNNTRKINIKWNFRI